MVQLDSSSRVEWVPATFITSEEHEGLTLRAYRGDSSVLLAFDLPTGQTKDLAGFAIECVTPSGKSFWLSNRISFEDGVHEDTPTRNRIWTPSNEAPFQKFRWVDFVRDDTPGPYKYRVSAMYFAQDGNVEPGTTGDIVIDIGPIIQGALKMGFTRGYLTRVRHESFSPPVRVAWLPRPPNDLRFLGRMPE